MGASPPRWAPYAVLACALCLAAAGVGVDLAGAVRARVAGADAPARPRDPLPTSDAPATPVPPSGAGGRLRAPDLLLGAPRAPQPDLEAELLDRVAGQIREPVVAVYAVGGRPLILVGGGRPPPPAAPGPGGGFPAGPLLRQLLAGSTTAGAGPRPPGPQGGSVVCGQVVSTASTGSYCGWADDAALGAIVRPDQTDAAALLDRVRAAVER